MRRKKITLLSQLLSSLKCFPFMCCQLFAWDLIPTFAFRDGAVCFPLNTLSHKKIEQTPLSVTSYHLHKQQYYDQTMKQWGNVSRTLNMLNKLEYGTGNPQGIRKINSVLQCSKTLWTESIQNIVRIHISWVLPPIFIIPEEPVNSTLPCCQT